MHVARLANAMAAVLGLCVHGRIPIAVIEDDRVRTGQIYTKPPTSSGENKAEDTWVGVEAIHELLSLVHTRGAIQAQIGQSVIGEELLLDKEETVRMDITDDEHGHD